jgi:hypothetical protein
MPALARAGIIQVTTATFGATAICDRLSHDARRRGITAPRVMSSSAATPSPRARTPSTARTLAGGAAVIEDPVDRSANLWTAHRTPGGPTTPHQPGDRGLRMDCEWQGACFYQDPWPLAE